MLLFSCTLACFCLCDFSFRLIRSLFVSWSLWCVVLCSVFHCNSLSQHNFRLRFNYFFVRFTLARDSVESYFIPAAESLNMKKKRAAKTLTHIQTQAHQTKTAGKNAVFSCATSVLSSFRLELEAHFIFVFFSVDFLAVYAVNLSQLLFVHLFLVSLMKSLSGCTLRENRPKLILWSQTQRIYRELQ